MRGPLPGMHRWLVPLVVAAALLAGARHVTRGHDWGDDFASYVMQAQSLATGDVASFVRRNAFTIFQSSTQIGPVAYPWGFPALLVPAYALAGLDPLALKLPGLACFGGFLVALYLLARRRLDRLRSLLVLVLFAFHPALLAFLDLILSDIPFLFLSTLALLLLDGLDPGTRGWKARSALAGLVILAALQTRTVGVLLLASAWVRDVVRAWPVRREPRRAIEALGPAAVVSLAVLLPALGIRQLVPDGSASYLAQLRGVGISMTLENAVRYFQDAGEFFTGSRNHPGILALLLLLAVAGAVRRGGREVLLLSYLALGGVTVCVWPEYQGLRFLFPMLPPLVILMVEGLDGLLARRPERLRTAVLVAVLVVGVPLVGIAHVLRAPEPGGVRGGPFDPDAAELFRHVRERTPPGAVVVFFKPRALRLLTGRDAILGADCAHVGRGDYVVLHRAAGTFDQVPPERLGACGLETEVVLENATFVARRIVR